VVLQGGFLDIQLPTQDVKSSFVRQGNTPPIRSDSGVNVGEVMAIEHNLLHVNFSPAHAKAMEESEVTAFHEKVLSDRQ
jgi:hypothetical protein